MDKINSKLDYLKGLLKGMELNGGKKNIIIEEIIDVLDLMNKEIRDQARKNTELYDRDLLSELFNDKNMKRNDLVGLDNPDILYDESVSSNEHREHNNYQTDQKVVLERICRHCGTYIRAEFDENDYEKVKIQCPKCKHFILQKDGFIRQNYVDNSFKWDEDLNLEDKDDGEEILNLDELRVGFNIEEDNESFKVKSKEEIVNEVEKNLNSEVITEEFVSEQINDNIILDSEDSTEDYEEYDDLALDSEDGTEEYDNLALDSEDGTKDYEEYDDLALDSEDGTKDYEEYDDLTLDLEDNTKDYELDEISDIDEKFPKFEDDFLTIDKGSDLDIDSSIVQVEDEILFNEFGTEPVLIDNNVESIEDDNEENTDENTNNFAVKELKEDEKVKIPYETINQVIDEIKESLTKDENAFKNNSNQKLEESVSDNNIDMDRENKDDIKKEQDNLESKNVKIDRKKEQGLFKRLFKK